MKELLPTRLHYAVCVCVFYGIFAHLKMTSGIAAHMHAAVMTHKKWYYFHRLCQSSSRQSFARTKCTFHSFVSFCSLHLIFGRHGNFLCVNQLLSERNGNGSLAVLWRRHRRTQYDTIYVWPFVVGISITMSYYYGRHFVNRWFHFTSFFSLTLCLDLTDRICSYIWMCWYWRR